jgi:hypothetical protein
VYKDQLSSISGDIPKWSKGAVCKTVVRGFDSPYRLQGELKKVKSKLLKLIDDYGSAMYDLGENTNPDDNYYSRQAGITLWKLKKYIENEVEVKTPEKHNGKARPTRNEV